MSNYSQAIKAYIRQFQATNYNSLPAVVESYDPDTNTATVQIVIKEMYPDNVSMKFPLIRKVPVIVAGSGKSHISSPIRQGHEVLLIFSDRAFDSWFRTGDYPVKPSTQRYNDLNDCIAITGLRNLQNSPQIATDALELIHKDDSGEELARIRLKDDKSLELVSAGGASVTLKDDGKIVIESASTVQIKNSSEELISIISELHQLLVDARVATIHGASPLLNAPAISALKGRLDTLKE